MAGPTLTFGRDRPAEMPTGLRCRSCDSGDLVPVLSLGRQPLANSLRSAEEMGSTEPRYPLELVFCGSCTLLQLTESIPPAEMFSEYLYFSSVIPGLIAHGKELSGRVIERRGLGPGHQVVEIASNDGYLLQHYRDAGIPVLGIEPARNIAAVAESRGIPTRCEFFGSELARRLRGEDVAADLIHAHNVLAHVPDPNDFAAGIATLLKPDGRAVVEVPYVRELLERGEFDTIYHEHVFYYSLSALHHLFARHGLVVEDVERIPIHGGSLRLFLAHAADAMTGGATQALLAEEREWGVDAAAPYLELAGKTEAIGRGLHELLGGLRAQGARLAAYGAAAKGSTLLNTFGLGREMLDYVVDISPHKQGLFMPGSGLPIVSPECLLADDAPDYLLILAWNFADEIREQQRAYRERGGNFIVPVPTPHVV